MRVTSILTPLVRREIPGLLNWIRYCPPPCPPDRINSITWYLSIDKSWTASDIALISRHVENSAYSFIDLKFISIGLSNEESVYLRNLPRKDSCDLEYGSKSGPNLQFFKSIEAISKYVTEGSGEAVILLETDAIPIRPYWLEILNTAISSRPRFWIAGGKYQGVSQLSPAIVNHMNGNAIYGVGAIGFGDFLLVWKDLVRYAVTRQHWIAYDIALSVLKYKHDNNIAVLEDDMSRILSKATTLTIDISELILNISGQHENSLDFIDHSLLSEKTLICHSRPLARRIAWCLNPATGLKMQALSQVNHLNQRLACLSINGMAYMNFDHPQSFSAAIGSYILNSRSFLRNDDLKKLVLACLSTPQGHLTLEDSFNG